MKKISILAFAFVLALSSCSSDDNNDSTPQAVIIPETPPQYAMTGKINGTTFEANNPFGNNEFSNTNIYSYYPIADYVLLQGRQGGTFGNPEIDIWLKRTDIVAGSYTIGQETFDTPPSHFIALVDYSNSTSEYTKAGVIVITEVNTSTKIVKGTFHFTTVDEISNPAAPVNYNVTEGTFNYKYAQ